MTDEAIRRRAADRELAREVARETVNQALAALGLHVGDDGEARHIQADFVWLRRSRKASEAIGAKAALVAVTVFVTAGMGAVWIGFADAIKRAIGVGP